MVIKMHTVIVWVMTLCSGRPVPVHKDILPCSGQKTREKVNKKQEMTIVTRSYVYEHGRYQDGG